MSYATATIAGHLGRDPETRTAGSGTVTTISVAVTRRGATRADDVTTWWKVSIWSKAGESAAKHLTKGSAVICTGWPEIEEWQDREGATRTTLRLRNAAWHFAPGRSTAPASGEAAPAPAAAPASPAAAEATNDEPPF